MAGAALRLDLAEIPAPEALQARLVVPGFNSYLRCYRLGPADESGCSVIVTREGGGWHISIASRSRYPTWLEISTARYRCVPEAVTMVMLLPPPSAYVNINEFCMHLVEIDPRAVRAGG